jgi:hypothetical protein
VSTDVTYKYNWREVPRDPKLNAKWRKRTLELSNRDHEDSLKFRGMLVKECRKDFWFWACGFAFVHEPRILDTGDEDSDALDALDSLNTRVPFLPWENQVPIVNHILKVLGKRDFRLVKSRAQGASWLMLLIAVWLWLFRKGAIINFVSKDEDSVDRKGDMNALFPKIDWLLEQLPEWMVGKKRVDWNRNHNNHTFTRTDGETAINGFACTANVATGGRALVFFMDEHGKHPRPQDRDAMASTQPVTRCRGCLSTPFGMDGEFAKIIHDDTISDPVLRLAWWDNPTQNKGLYKIVKGKPVPIDEEKFGPLPAEYYDYAKWNSLKTRLEERGYDLTATDKYRSPWYDEECLRQGADPVLIAQEYDMNFGSSVSRFFADALINRLLNRAVRPIRGEIHVDVETLTGTWSENPDGRFRTWTEFNIDGHPPLGEYIVGCDISAGLGGSGGSNSSLTVLDRRKGRKVFGFISPSVKPYEFAEIAIAVCKLFCNYRGDPGFLIWEAQGPGNEFTQRIERAGFQHYFRRKASDDAGLHSRHSNKPGFWMTKRSRVLGPYREALLEGSFDNPDQVAIEELKQYHMGTDGEPYHVASKDKTAPGGAGRAHGDVCISDSLAWFAALCFGDQHNQYARRNNQPTVMNVKPGDVAPNSFAWRRAQYLQTLGQRKQQPNW